jgi:hypothetical protein
MELMLLQFLHCAAARVSQCGHLKDAERLSGAIFFLHLGHLIPD